MEIAAAPAAAAAPVEPAKGWAVGVATWIHAAGAEGGSCAPRDPAGALAVQMVARGPPIPVLHLRPPPHPRFVSSFLCLVAEVAFASMSRFGLSMVGECFHAAQLANAAASHRCPPRGSLVPPAARAREGVQRVRAVTTPAGRGVEASLPPPPRWMHSHPRQPRGWGGQGFAAQTKCWKKRLWRLEFDRWRAREGPIRHPKNAAVSKAHECTN